MAPKQPDYTCIDRPQPLADLTDAVRRADRIAIDTEADSFHHFHEKVCLIQITHAHRHWLLDPLAGLDLTDFLAALRDTEMILHDAGYDLRMLRKIYDFQPAAPIFDTMLAAQLVGIRKFGLVNLVEQVCDVQLSKKGQKSDWSRRPLSQEQLDYAVEDTRHLEHIADFLRDKLETLGRLDWHRESCEWMVASALAEKTDDGRSPWRIKGSHSLTPRQLAYVRQLWHWRHQQARSADLPEFKVLGNKHLIEIALEADAGRRGRVEKWTRLPRTCRGGRLEKLNEAIDIARALPPDKWPSPPKTTKCPPAVLETRDVADLLVTRTRKIAHELGIEPQIIASRATLAAIACRKTADPEEIQEAGPLMNWQAALLTPMIQETMIQQGFAPPVTKPTP